jgi:glycosyltransferase involved in cell wall biosynthesis
MQPILSICIPTYNRCEILKDSIQDLLLVLSDKNIELCISNNSSTDGTEHFLNSIIKDNKSVRVINQKQNNGLEQNMVDAIKMATGSYILPIGDDEKIDVSLISMLIKCFVGEPDLILLNGLHGENQQLSSNLFDKEFSNPEIAFPYIWEKMQPGSFVVKGDVLKCNYYLNYIGTSHAYAGWVLDYLHAKYYRGTFNKIVFFKELLIEYKEEEKTWRNDAFRIIYYEIPLWLNILSDKYTVIRKDKILDNYLKDLSQFSCLFSFLIENDNYIKDVKKHMSFFNQKQIRFAKLIGLIPQGLARSYKKNLNYLKGKIKWIIRW